MRVDVTVIGNGDKGVPDLTAADFEVSEDGVPQTVATVQFVRVTGRPGGADETNLEIRSRDHAEAEAAREDVRLFVIFFDDYHIEKLPAITIPLRRELTTFVNRLQPTDLVAIVDPLTLASHIEFTRDQARAARHRPELRGADVRDLPDQERRGGGPAEERRRSCGCARRSPTRRSRPSACGSAALREGRKTIIFVSQGPPIMLADAGTSSSTFAAPPTRRIART